MASNEDDVALVLLSLALILKKKETTVKIKRKKWCKRWLLKRETYGHVILLKELKFEPRATITMRINGCRQIDVDREL